ncbi:MAG TPA: ACP phosphodiesterase [Puia sp.]|nr:ACP phosphodiesterase [Puia sp.]
MNYLAHAYLSFGIPAITVGNLISDFVKGKQQFTYPAAIQQGIVLHRAIDTFTDTHAITRRAKAFFREPYGLYAGPLVDVAYDHFLANDPHAFAEPDEDTGGHAFADRGNATSGIDLKAFAQHTYAQIQENEAFLPERFARMFFYMRTQDWLYNYRHRQGILNSFIGLSRRAAYMGSAEAAGRLFETHYTQLQACYREFFPGLREFALRTLQQLQHENG